MELVCIDGVIYLQLNSGTLQGDSIACTWFLCIYHLVIDKFLADTFDEGLSTTVSWLKNAIASPNKQEELIAVSNESIDISANTFADDLLKTRRCDNYLKFVSQAEEHSNCLTLRLREVDIEQNAEKCETIVHFCGTNSYTYTKNAYTHRSKGKVLRSMKYLGRLLAYNKSNRPEMNKRTDSIRKGWFCLGNFWRSNTFFKFKRIVFNSMVVGSGISGLKCLQS